MRMGRRIWSQTAEGPGFSFLQVAMRRLGGLVFKNWSSVLERIPPSLTLKSSGPSQTMKMEGYEGGQTHFISLLSIGPDHLMPKVTEPSSRNIRLILSCAPGG